MEQEPKVKAEESFKCFYCETHLISDLERIKHIDIEHPGRLHHPTSDDFEKRLER